MEDLPSPTVRELEILKVLWEKGPSSVRLVHEELNQDGAEDLAYNTVQTLLRVMENKELVSHHVEGRTFIYTPNFSREESASRFLDRVFDGAASQLVMSLLKAEKIPPEELNQLHQLIEQAKAKQQQLRSKGR